MAAESPSPATASGAGLRPESRDLHQGLRLRRFLMAAGTALLLPAVLLAAAAVGVVPYRSAGIAGALIAAFVVLFYALFRSGLNLRFPDPSLTGEQILAALLCVAVVGHEAGAARPLVAMFYLVAMLFGALRLGARRLLALALVAVAAHGVSLWLWHQGNPGIDTAASWVEIVALALVLPWFAAMGAYVNSLRARLTDSNRRLKLAFDRIEEIAIRDELTGLYNRRFLMEALAREQARARRLGARCSVCLFDIDHFKSINDGFGHPAGDAVLRHFAALARNGLRAMDVLGRQGGEEFLLVLPDTGAQGARTAAERVRSTVEAAGFPGLPAGRRVTVTIGVATLRGDESPSALLARADQALYSGKTAGRNRVVTIG